MMVRCPLPDAEADQRSRAAVHLVPERPVRVAIPLVARDQGLALGIAVGGLVEHFADGEAVPGLQAGGRRARLAFEYECY